MHITSNLKYWHSYKLWNIYIYPLAIAPIQIAYIIEYNADNFRRKP